MNKQHVLKELNNKNSNFSEPLQEDTIEKTIAEEIDEIVKLCDANYRKHLCSSSAQPHKSPSRIPIFQDHENQCYANKTTTSKLSSKRAIQKCGDCSRSKNSIIIKPEEWYPSRRNYVTMKRPHTSIGKLERATDQLQSCNVIPITNPNKVISNNNLTRRNCSTSSIQIKLKDVSENSNYSNLVLNSNRADLEDLKHNPFHLLFFDEIEAVKQIQNEFKAVQRENSTLQETKTELREIYLSATSIVKTNNSSRIPRFQYHRNVENSSDIPNKNTSRLTKNAIILSKPNSKIDQKFSKLPISYNNYSSKSNFLSAENKCIPIKRPNTSTMKCRKVSETNIVIMKRPNSHLSFRM